MAPELCIVFVCQKGELELKALLLAASLRYHSATEQQAIDMVAAIPDPDLWGNISAKTSALLNELGVRQVVIDCPFGKEYPIGNKLAAIGVGTKAPVTVFIDSDILCLSAFSVDSLQTRGLKSKPADLSTFEGSASQWQTIYQMIDAELPSERVITTVSRDVALPYFNAGLVCVANGEVFSKKWLEIAKLVDACASVTHKRPWLDQITLPVAAKALSYKFDVLSEHWNFPAHLKPLNEAHLPVFCHYHSPDVIASEPALCTLVETLSKKHPHIQALIHENTAWQAILVRAKRHSVVQKPARFPFSFVNRLAGKLPAKTDFLISGLPRSGTSLLCNLLHQSADMVVINEPREIFSHLKDHMAGHALSLYYRRLRTDILLDRPIENKVDAQGKVIEDTRITDSRTAYRPRVSHPHFHLGTKNPLAYLSRLEVLCHSLPHIPKIVMVRHPYKVISSWVASFPHLRDVDLSVIPFTDTQDPLLATWQKQQLHAISKETHLPVRRALLFNYLVESILRVRDRIHLVRYEDLTANPKETMGAVSRYIEARPLSNKVLSTVRTNNQQSHITEEDKYAIDLLCGDAMHCLKYSNEA
ncbi:sulfotransferase [Aestuariibacter sp. A3R04]|uniref:sulfotransferase family protein n=1 Tax=Aestuariibacter sp. A3R04 TaxID=2841571 RepID=UPI001C08BC69|nr:sulfotransferase [Aestuariibacter sp. A3R04]MBU3023393.1 sulfotransferase [Aestuariibacter sp. A3R04]